MSASRPTERAHIHFHEQLTPCQADKVLFGSSAPGGRSMTTEGPDKAMRCRVRAFSIRPCRRWSG